MAAKGSSSQLPFADSIAGAGDIEAGFSGGIPSLYPFYFTRGSNYSSFQTTASVFFDDVSDDGCHHFLDSCFLCKKELTGNRDIYMYRGDMPFCSKECREDQIERDDARERSWKISMRKEQQQRHKKSLSPTKSQRIGIRAGTVVPA